MEPEEKLFLELRIKPEKWLALTRKMYSKRWMRLPMPSRIAVNRQLFQILRCRQLMARRLLWQKFLKADSGHITLKRLDEREAYMSVLLEQPGLLTSIWSKSWCLREAIVILIRRYVLDWVLQKKKLIRFVKRWRSRQSKMPIMRSRKHR